MKTIRFATTFIITLFLTVANSFGQNGNKKATKSIALVELFTSEGCSSCPPADALMGRLQDEYKNKNVYILAYHVDYWDRQGWKDVFSNALYTKRQYDYAAWMDKEPIYTPQVIINGTSEHIGSQESIVRASISKALTKPAVAELSLKAIQNKNVLTVNYIVKGVSKNDRLLIAVVQRTAQTTVKRGENGGRVLSHYQIVRELQSSVLIQDGKGTSKVSLPKDFNTKDFEVIGFVQNPKNGSILGAAKAAF